MARTRSTSIPSPTPAPAPAPAPADQAERMPKTRQARRALATAGVMAAVVSAGVVGLAAPASALVTVSTSGTTVTVNVSGTETIRTSCVASKVSVNGATGSPAVACASFTKLVVNGDSAAQTVEGGDLESAVFAAKPSLTATLGDGVDTVTPTTRADTIDLGGGNDRLYLVRGTTDALLEGGADTDYIRLQGSDGVDDTFTASSNGTILTFNHAVGGVVRSGTAKNFERIEAATFSGNDSIDFSGITTASSLKNAGIYAGDGDDIVRGAQFASDLFAGPGTNQIFGGAGNDNIGSEGNGDVIKPGDGSNRINDRLSGRSGRTIDNVGVSNWYFFEGTLGDTTTRIRPGTSGSTVVTHSLTRTGQQVLGSSYKNVSDQFVVNAAGSARGLADVVALDNSRKIYARGDAADDDLMDVTIPAGSWTTVGTPQTTYFITPSNPAYAVVQASDMGQVSIHGPWTNKDKGFVHRVTRDLMFRFVDGGTLNTTSAALTAGTTTRPVVIDSLMDTDEYRGLDVDRTFTRFLRRTVDPSGRTYWINSIGNGKALWRFRAQLFGSNEYFTKAGGTNASYLEKVYYDVLGRQIDPSGKAYWGKKLDNGADRGSVALNFINSSEFRRFVVDDQFLRFLDRKATTAEHTTWDAKITGTTTGEQDLIASLAASDEYYGRS